MRKSIRKAIAYLTLLTVTAATGAAETPTTPTVKLYGFTKFDAIYATQRTFAGDLNFYLLPTVAGQTQRSLNITARESRFGLDLSGPTVNGWSPTGKIELDFYSSAFGGGNENNAAPRIRLAFADFANDSGFSVRAGQDWDALVTVLPITVDAAVLGGYGNLYGRRPQLRLTQVLKKGNVSLTGRVAAVRTIGQVTDAGGTQDGGTDAGSPTVQGALFVDAKLWTQKAARLSIAGHTGTETVAPAAGNPALREYATRSLIAGVILPVTEAVTLQGTYWQGADLKSLFGGINQGINTTLGRSIEAKGGWAQAVTKITPSLNLNLGYGYDDPDDADLNANDRTLNTRAFGSVLYQVTTAIVLAAEYSNLSTEYRNAPTARGEIYQASAIYKF